MSVVRIERTKGAVDMTDAQLEEMAGKLLANMVIENYRIERLAA